MGSPDSESPTPPTAKPKQAEKALEKKSVPASSLKHLSVVRSSAQREDVEKDDPQYGWETEQPAAGHTNRRFQEVASRQSSQVSTRVHSQRGNRRSRRARRRGRFRILRFHLRVALRQFRRFHNRFTFRQVLGFYIGVPACLSLALCLVFLFGKPPAAVTPGLVSHRKPSAVELVQQIQSALGRHDSRSAHSAVAGLEELYPKDPRTYVARGTVFANEKNYDEARLSYLHALELVRDLPPALINLGEVEFAIGNYSQAADYYERAGQRLPSNSLILFRRYLCYSLLKDRTKTEGVMKELSARPDTVEWYFIQASESVRAGKNSEAQRLVATAKTLFGEQAAAYQESLKKIGWLK